jgi:CheY-like chemotaxis protein
VFTDVEMPGTMDGIKLCRYIRDRWPPVKLLVASGKMIVAESELPSGAMFFSKPYGHTAVTSAIGSLLAS